MSVTARRIRETAKTYSILPAEQIGGRRQRGTETALDLLTSQIREVRKSKKYIATLLSIDILGAFDIVNYIRLLNTLRKIRFPY